jgi:uncharacterized membrane protein YphA (DoxX/SURF4 family)
MNKNGLLAVRITVAIILIQTLRFKFTAHEDSVYIFTKVGLEPYGRIGIGVLELISSILLIIPKTIWIGALLTFGIIGGALMMHVTKRGIEINNDGGNLFYIAIVTFILSGIILFDQRKRLPIIGSKF